LEGEKTYLVKYGKKAEKNDVIDIAFPIVHGTNVEDGTIAGFLKMYNLPFVGCDILSSAVGMNKYIMKSVFRDNGIPVLDAVKISVKEYDYKTDSVISGIEEKFGYPVIVKPIDLGSSIGISKASNTEELYDSLENAFLFANKVLVEKAVANLKEINCAVLGDYTEAQASECEEPVNSEGILSFADKYIGDGSAKGAKGAKAGVKSAPGGSQGMATLKRKIPAEITAEQKATIQRYAVDAFKVLGCNGVSRIDFMMNTATGEIWLNEINTIPGSLSFYLWEPICVPYSKLLDNMISLALKRDREEKSLTYTFESNVLEGVKLGGGAKGAKGSKI